jgi:hypothetical protein
MNATMRAFLPMLPWLLSGALILPNRDAQAWRGALQVSEPRSFKPKTSATSRPARVDIRESPQVIIGYSDFAGEGSHKPDVPSFVVF